MVIAQNDTGSIGPGGQASGSPLKVGPSFVLPPGSTKTLPLALVNQGGQDTDWEIAPIDVGWLTLDRNNGHIMAHEVQTLYVRANSTGLALGNYQTTLTLQSGNMESVPLTVELEVCIGAYDDNGPHIIVGQTANFSQAAPQDTMSWQVTNPVSNGPVTWTVNKGEVQWVIVNVEPGASILQGGDQATIVATIDKSGLAPGDYRTDIVFTITFEPNDKKREPASVLFPVTVTIPNP